MSSSEEGSGAEGMCTLAASIASSRLSEFFVSSSKPIGTPDTVDSPSPILQAPAAEAGRGRVLIVRCDKWRRRTQCPTDSVPDVAGL